MKTLKPKLSDRILRMNELVIKTGMSKSLIYALISKGKFPKGFALSNGGRATGWFESSIDNHLIQLESEGL
jgi:prophage regulatory protein